MKLLLDTHVWLWSFLDPERISSRALELMGDPDTALLLSAASSWEISIKYSLKRLKLPEPPARYIPSALERGGVTPTPVEHTHAIRVAELPHHHGDPFDRLLIAQAQLEKATLATADPWFLLYDVDVLWVSAEEPPSAVHDARRPSRLNESLYLAPGKRGRRSRSVAPRTTTASANRVTRARKAK